MAVLVLIARALLGGLFLVAGVFKAHDGIAATASSIAAYRLLPAVVVAPLGLILPYFEIGLGGYLIAGLFTRTAGWIAALQLVVFAIAVGSLVVRHIPASCGCFGSADTMPPSWGHVAADIALALVALGIARFGPGALAVDARLGGGSALSGSEGS
jgi:uncharacterized membrane protein YphA (DoxX/SURF4 family)